MKNKEVTPTQWLLIMLTLMWALSFLQDSFTK